MQDEDDSGGKTQLEQNVHRGGRIPEPAGPGRNGTAWVSAPVYHCTIHPSMVGGFNGSSGNGPRSPGYGGYMGGH